MIPCCGDCKYWKKFEEMDFVGECRRFPKHEQTQQDDFCFEFKDEKSVKEILKEADTTYHPF